LNKISPELKGLREWLTWFVLPEFEDINQIKAEKIRVNWDLSQMLALQDDIDALHARAREDFKAGGITLNEYREAIKLMPDPKGDYYLQPFSLTAISPENRAAEAVRKVEAGTNPNDDGNGENDDESDAKASNEAKKLIATVEPKLLPEKKTFEFEGLTLSREPNEIEKLIDLKSLVSDLDAQSESLTTSLLKYRDALINQAVSAAKDLDNQTIHTLTLERNEKLAKFVGKSLGEAFQIGRAQIIREINAQQEKNKSLGKDVFPNFQFLHLKELSDDDLREKLAGLSDSVIAKLLNEIQSRTINAFTALKLLGWEAGGFFDELKKRLVGESTSFVSQTSRNAANAAIMQGRKEEIEAQADNWERVQYSAILDKNTCPACKAEDGKEADAETKLVPVPNSNCDGGSNCRCFHVVILD
jgi:hypothetical protein